MNYYLFINKNSGNGNSANKFTYLKTHLNNNDRLSIHETTTVKDMYSVLDKYFDDIDVLVFAGGDGTIREALRYCYINKVDKPIGIIPAGTGNDYIRSLNIPNDVEKATDVILNGHTTRVHAVALNNDYYFNIASVGLDAEIVRQHKKMRRYIKGPSSYYISALYKLATFKPEFITLFIDGEEIINKYMLIAVANGKFYGGGMNVAPTADVTSDYLSVLCLDKIPRYKLPYYFARMQNGEHMNLKNIDYYECNHLTIKSDKELAFNLDGDLIIGNYVDISIKNDHQLKIFSPSD